MREVINKDYNYTIISAINITKLKSNVRELGFGFTEFISRWVKDGEKFDERSLLIGNIDKETALKLGIKYNQYSIIYKDINGCFEICTTPFDNYNVGDIIKEFNISGNHILNIDDAKEIFIRRKGVGEYFELHEVFQPRPSVFETEERTERLI